MCYMIVGNHDTYFKNTNEVNSLDELIGGRYDNIKIYSEAQDVVFDDVPIFFIPWINSSNYQRTLEEMKNSKTNTYYRTFRD